MKHRSALMAAFCAAALVAAPGARAAEAPQEPGTQQSRFAACAHESKGLRGEEHQAFMSDCLKGSAEGEPRHDKEHASQRASAEPGAQQSRMKSCNEEAGRKNLHGDERRAFMSSCLKG